MNWTEYGKWRHPKEWWQNKLIQWMESAQKDKLKRKPISVLDWKNTIAHFKHLKKQY